MSMNLETGHVFIYKQKVSEGLQYIIELSGGAIPAKTLRELATTLNSLDTEKVKKINFSHEDFKKTEGKELLTKGERDRLFILVEDPKFIVVRNSK